MGKARDTKSFESEQSLINQKLFSIINRPRQGTAFAVTPNAATPTPFNLLPTCGGIMNGAIGDNASIVTISSGTADISMSSGKFAGYVIVKSETGTADNLDNIPAVFAGQTLWLQAFSGHTISLTTSGNIASAHTLNSNELIILKWDYTNSKWRLITGGSGDGVSFPITPTIHDYSDTWTSPVALDLSASDGHIHKFTVDADLTLTFSTPPSSGTQMEFELELEHDGVGGTFTVTLPSSVRQLSTISVPLDARGIYTFRTNDGGVNYDVVQIVSGTSGGSGSVSPLTTKGDLWGFSTLDARIPIGTNTFVLTADSTETLGAKWADPNVWTENVDAANFELDNVSSLISNATNPAISGSSNVVRLGNQERIAWRNASNSADLYLKTTSTDAFEINEDFLPDTTGTRAMGASGKKWGTLHVNNIDTTTLLTSTIGSTNILNGAGITGGLVYVDGVKQTFNPDATNAGLNVGTHTAAPSTPVDGDVYLNSTDNKFYARISGAWVDLGASASGIANVVEDLTPELGGNLDALGNTIDNVSEFISNATNPASSGSSSVIRLGNQERISWRNAANTADIYIKTKSTDAIEINEDFLPSTTTTYSLGASSFRWSTLWTQAVDCSNTLTVDGNAILNGNTDIGNAATDTLSVTAEVDTNFVPNGNLTKNLGSASKHWDTAYTGTLDCDGDLNVQDNVTSDLDFISGKYIDLADTSGSVSTGSISLVDCEGFVSIKVNGAIKKLAYWS